MNLKYGEPVGYGSVDEMNREEDERVQGECLDKTVSAEKLSQDSYKMGFREGLLRAAEIAEKLYQDVGRWSVVDLAEEIRKEAKSE